ncbi:MAG: hypothetical protein AUK27_08345 [Deltaproteobacteria bacterium CG2_30_66_27]|nr:MAG: hypothetical protein AUK27_08345 [Deltaproteobacteria bacterium CG2_30_66_27]PJB30822.1 MAG: hypothetical protein CO109_13290 [Deltaproteobacteria bacterium CG_4_9_14_3_um_filter_65_9]
MKGLTVALRAALALDRERYVVSAGPLPGYAPGAVYASARLVTPVFLGVVFEAIPGTPRRP